MTVPEVVDIDVVMSAGEHGATMHRVTITWADGTTSEGEAASGDVAMLRAIEARRRQQ